MNNVIILLVAILFVILFRLYFDIKERVERYKHYVDTLYDAFYRTTQINDNIINHRTQNMISELISAVHDKKEEKKND